MAIRHSDATMQTAKLVGIVVVSLFLRTSHTADILPPTPEPGPRASTPGNVTPSRSFAVDMIRPYGKSTIRYKHTPLPDGPAANTTEQPRLWTAPDQAYSVSVAAYNCLQGDGQSRKRRRQKKRPRTAGGRSTGDGPAARPTNTVWPLPRLAADDDRSATAAGRRAFRVPGDQLRLLYTVRRGPKTTATLAVAAETMAMTEDGDGAFAYVAADDHANG